MQLDNGIADTFVSSVCGEFLLAWSISGISWMENSPVIQTWRHCSRYESMGNTIV